jgi:Mannose-6-phosphate isomerase
MNKEEELIIKTTGCTAINIGKMNDLKDHFIIHPVSQRKVEGKVFLKDKTDATGTEISFNTIPPQTEVPYFHTHWENEETYIILKGAGDFQVNDDSFPIQEGSVIRVATRATRGLRNTSDEAMIYMVVQSKENSLGNYSSDDGERTEFNPKWE